MRPWIASQLFLPEGRVPPPGRIRDAVLAARRAAGMAALIIWAGAAETARGEAVAACRECGVTPYLWFPVLADAPGAAFDRHRLVMAAGGTRGNGRSGAWEELAGGGEAFEFLCPNDGPALDAVFDCYAALLDRAGVDGVMLDRIRFPSPANGFEALFTCFCDACAARFRRELGYPLATLQARARDFLESMRDWAPGEPAGGRAESAGGRADGGRAARGEEAEGAAGRWGRPDALWEEAGLLDLAAFRALSVGSVVRRFAGLARERRLRVGLDLFSPSLAGLVAQDYRSLAAYCDWIKPMTYCHAVGPAGLPLELASLARAILLLCPRLREADALALLRRAFRWDIPESLPRLLADGLPERVLSPELKRTRAMGLPRRVGLFPGIEAVSIPRFGIDITEPMLERYLAALGEGAPGLVASWDLLAIPPGNLRRLGAM